MPDTCFIRKRVGFSVYQRYTSAFFYYSKLQAHSYAVTITDSSVTYLQHLHQCDVIRLEDIGAIPGRHCWVFSNCLLSGDLGNIAEINNAVVEQKRASFLKLSINMAHFHNDISIRLDCSSHQ